jgi:predicted  nucleic acid-binding Zn-ribbon protein
MASNIIGITSKAKHAFNKLKKNDDNLLAEIFKKIELLEKGKLEALDIRHIKRKNGKHRIEEIRIRQPSSYRVFYIHLLWKRNEIIIVDGRKKKVGKFPPTYFKELDKCIDEYLKSN